MGLPTTVQYAPRLEATHPDFLLRNDAMAALHTHYDTLQISETASPEVIRGAYRYLSQKWHPDKHPKQTAEAQDMMARLNEAYSVLSDPEQRRKYDAWLAEERGPASRHGGESAKRHSADDQSTDSEMALRVYYAGEIAKGRDWWVAIISFVLGSFVLSLLTGWISALDKLVDNHPLITLLLLLAYVGGVTQHVRKDHQAKLLREVIPPQNRSNRK